MPESLPAGTVEVRERNGGLTQDIRAGNHTLIGDEPREVGGADEGPTPYDYLLTALGTCTSMTLRMYANRKQWPLESVQVRLQHDRIHAKDCEDCETENGRIDRIRKEITVTGALDADQLARLAEIADRCPVHRTLMNEKKIETKIALDTK